MGRPKPLTILGIDASWTGCALTALTFDDDSGKSEVRSRVATTLVTTLKKHPNPQERLDTMGLQFVEFVEDTQPAFAAIEGYSYGSKTGGPMAGELGGHLRWLLWKAKLRFMVVPPTSLKKYVTGAGNAAKSAMMMGALKKWGYESTDDNDCDSYSLTRLGYEYYCDKSTKAFSAIAKKCELGNAGRA